MAATKVAFNRDNINAVTCAAGKDRAWVYDTKVPGLALMTTAAGAKSFYHYRWFNGKPERTRLGGYPAMTPEQARDAATKANGKVAEGVSPAQEKRARRQELTIGELFQDWLERHAKVHKKSWQRDEQNFNLHLADLKDLKLSAVKRSDVTTLHVKLGSGEGAPGPYLANRMLALLSALFNWAQREHGYTQLNPCKGIKKFREQSRERFLGADELPRFLAAVEQDPSPDMRDFFWLLLLTGARRSNVAAMQWAHVNLATKVWLIPDTKGGIPVMVPLVPKALEILKARAKAAVEGTAEAVEDGEVVKAARLETWVFPSHSASGHLQEPKKAWAELLKRAKLADLRIHDLRRTLGSWQAAQGASLTVIGKSLGHRNQATTAVYARLSLGPVRDSVTTAARAMLATAKPKRRRVKSQVKGGEGKGEGAEALPPPSGV